MRPAVAPSRKPRARWSAAAWIRSRDALEAEARVEDVAGQHRHAVRAVAGRRGDPRADRAGLADAFLEDLPVLRLLVVEQLVAVLGLVELARRRIDRHLPEQRLHAERARLVGDDRHDVRTERRVAQHLRQELHEHHRRRLLAAPRGSVAGTRPLDPLGERRERRHGERGCRVGTRRQVPAEFVAARVKVAHLRAVRRRRVVRELVHIAVGERQREAVAEGEQRVVLELLRLVRAHLPLRPVPHPVALLGLRQDHGRLAAVTHGGVVRGVDLHRVVAATAQAVDVVVGEVRDEGLELRVPAEEVLAVEAPIGRRVLLELAVDRLVQALQDHVIVVTREQRVPLRAPQQLDHVPAGAGEESLELLDDRAVAAHRTVETLQVAVDDEDQIVEALALRRVTGRRATRARPFRRRRRSVHTLRPFVSSTDRSSR